MGKSLSLGIRERVVALVDEGLSCHDAARRLRISAASAVRIMQRKTRTGWVRTRVEAEPDITMPELAEALKVELDLSATPAMPSRHLIHRLGFTYKKIADRDGEAAQKGPRRAIRVAASPDAEDAS
jgi:transposase